MTQLGESGPVVGPLGDQLLEAGLEAALELTVAHHQGRVLIPRRQADALRHARVKLWRGRNDIYKTF